MKELDLLTKKPVTKGKKRKSPVKSRLKKLNGWISQNKATIEVTSKLIFFAIAEIFRKTDLKVLIQGIKSFFF